MTYILEDYLTLSMMIGILLMVAGFIFKSNDLQLIRGIVFIQFGLIFVVFAIN